MPAQNRKIGFLQQGVAMTNKQEAYKLLEKLAAENDYVIVHSRELRILIDDLKDLQARVKVARQELIDMTGDMA
jgi:ABC-type sugar transport system ATPase subunit